MTDTDLAAAGELAMPELRYAVAPITNVEVRDAEGNGDGTWTMSGYAAVFGQKTILYDGKFFRMTEDIDPAAFDTVLRSQGLREPAGVVHFNFGHDMNRAVAATDVEPGKAGWLDLRADDKGLFYLAKVSRDDPDAVAMASKMRSGVLKQASFAFTIAKAETTDTENAEGPDEEHRRILEVGHLYDVCACPQGAYAQTVSQLRTYAAGIGQFNAGVLSPEEVRALEAMPVSPTVVGGGIAVSPTGGGVVSRRLTAQELRRVGRYTRKA